MAKVLTRRASSGKGLVCGIGIYEPRVLCMTDAPHLPQIYSMWLCMLVRTTTRYAACFPTYAGVSVAPDFHRFSDFAEWAVRQIGWDRKGYHLDKDLIRKGSRVYSPDTCTFLPQKVNLLLLTRVNHRGKLPIGVTKGRRGKGYQARTKVDGKNTYLGLFDDPEQAFMAYKMAKESNIQRMAAIYRNDIDPRAYAALMAYQVEITD